MASASKQSKPDVTTPFLAWVGAGDLALESLRKAAAELQAQLDGARTQVLTVQRDPMAAAEQARARLTQRFEALAQDARKGQTRLEGRLAELQAEALSLPKQAQARVTDLQGEAARLPERLQVRVAELQGELRALPKRLETRATELRAQVNEVVNEQVEAFSAFAARGEGVVARVRGTEPVQAVKAEEVAVVELVQGEGAAKKAAAQRTAAKKAPAKKAPAKKAPAKPAAPRRSTTRGTTA